MQKDFKYLKILKGIFNDRPQHIIFFVTSKCNARCKMCFYWKGIEEERDELSIEEIKEISSRIIPFDYLTITGGEPFLREDLPGICQAFIDKVQFIHIPTNASLPSTIGSQFRKILATCRDIFFKISLSMEGLYKDHDEIKKLDGSFEKLLKTYEIINGLKGEFGNFEINIITTFSHFNQERIKGICDFVKSNMEIDNHNINFIRGHPRVKKAGDVSTSLYEEAIMYLGGDSHHEGNVRYPFFLRILYAMKSLARDFVLRTLKENREILPCVAGRKMVVIGDTGVVYPCELLDKKLGDLRASEYDLMKVLNSDEAEATRSFIGKTSCFCTFECAIQNNIVFNFRAYPALLLKLIKTMRP